MILHPHGLRHLLLYAVIVLAFGACGGMFRSDAVRPDGIELHGPAREELLNELIKASAAIATLKGVSRTEFRDPSPYTLRHIFAVEYPKKLRLEVMPVGQNFSLALLLLSDQQIRFFNREERSYSEGSDSVADMKRLLAIPFRAAHLAYLLKGQLSVELLRRPDTRLFVNDPGRSITVQTADRTVTARYSSGEGGIKLSAADFRDVNSSVLLAKVRFHAYQNAGGFFLPQEIEIDSPRYEVSATMRLHDLVADIPISNRVFSVPTPPGYSKR